MLNLELDDIIRFYADSDPSVWRVLGRARRTEPGDDRTLAESAGRREGGD